MKKIYTCFTCGFPFAVDESEVPSECPACGSPKSQYLEEPWNGSIESRRIHVDFPKPDPNWDPMDINFHHPKNFEPKSMHGRIRRFVIPYDDAAKTRSFYSDAMDWDIINTEHADTKNPLMYCATGPGNANWEPSVPSFGYGFLKSRDSANAVRNPSFVVEVDNLADTLEKVEEFGGKVIAERYMVEKDVYAQIEDSEGNVIYLWDTPADVDWSLPETLYLSKRPEKIVPYASPAKVDPKKYPYRAPKKYPKKDLHGRLRFLTYSYKNFERWHKFVVNVFHWDMFELPVAAGGMEKGSPNPSLLIATGPSYETYEGATPGHMNAMAHYAGDNHDLEPIVPMLEINMWEPLTDTLNDLISKGAVLVGDMPEEKEGWTSSAYVLDPSGNKLYLWKCPSSRTWEEPEGAYDIE